MASVMRNISENSNLTSNEDTGYPLGVQILIGLVLAAIICLSLIGNTVVCVAILTERNLRKAGNYFLVSLAIADLLVAGTVMVFAGANDIMGRWIFGRHFCKIWLSLDIMCSTASILNLCAVSLDRYLHVRAPLHYDIKMSTFRAVLAIGLIWACSALISFLPIHLDWHVRSKAIFNGFCVMDLNPIYATASSLVSFYAPCIVMIVLYLRLFQSARRHVRSIRRGTFDRSAYKVSDAKAATTLGIIMGTFLVCWLPFFTVNLIAAFCDKCIPSYAFIIVTWLGYANSTLNPVIYSIFNAEFRMAFKKVLSRCIPTFGTTVTQSISGRTSSVVNGHGLSPSHSYRPVSQQITNL